ncbi:hypothetical protein RA307_16465 [Xanthobacteraceae bacterium Astr-EGSB]|uniref:hypothetical protein n=1 Tax=Astrobacterium formosum TaxID=3069710 RepID=UPI0027AE1762|nr:hypothetical protein [Xanthobacteraceae bacterium Astr-EGSB]
MAYAFDTLGYSKRLRDGGVPQAEAHAEAARDFVMVELVTKTDLQGAVTLVQSQIETQTLRLTVRLGAMLATGIAILAAMQKLS